MRESIGEAICSVIYDTLIARFVGEDKDFDFICEPDAIIELREEFHAADDTLTSYTAFPSSKFGLF